MNLQSIGSLLHYCAKTKSYRHGISLHAASIKSALQFDTVIANHALNMYAKCGKISSARRLFDEMPDRNLISWSALISGCDQSGHHLAALELFSKLPFVPNEYIYSSAVRSCAALKMLLTGQQVHSHSLKVGYECISFVANSLITMYMKLGRCDDAVSVSASVSDPSLVHFNALISGFEENHLPHKSIEMFKAVILQGLLPDKFTFVALSGVCPESSNLTTGMLLHCLTVKLGLDSIPIVGNLVMTMYSKFSSIDSVEKVFRSIEQKDVISWNTLMTASSQSFEYVKGLKFFIEMISERNVQPDNFTFASLLAHCAKLASIHHGKQIHAHLIRTNLLLDTGVFNALVDMYAKCGFLKNANAVFERMPYRNIVSWNTIIAGLGNHGLGLRAIAVFEQMQGKAIKPDSRTFVGILIACNHSGLVDKGLEYFNTMKESYNVSPDLEHFSCLIDMLGRAGRLHEAEEYINNHPFGNDPIILGSLLSSCRLHKDVSIGEPLARKLLQLQPITTSPYVLLSNLHASDEDWGSAAEARKLLRFSGLKKEPGYSQIEFNGSFERFTIGDFSHSRIEEIKHMLGNLNRVATEISARYAP